MTQRPWTIPHPVTVRGATLGVERPFFITGPCVLETRELTFEIAGHLAELFAARELPFIFKASFDKANRSSLAGGRGPGLEQGLGWLAEIRRELDVAVMTDVHTCEQCSVAAEAVDVLQIPAFLCRQTDLILAAAATGAALNLKKGQFLAPWDMSNVVDKATSGGNGRVLVTERGTSFGYGRLVVDMTGFAALAEIGYPVVFDATHSVQEPGALGTATGGDRSKVPALARAAVATGSVSGLFFEVHPQPERSPSDGANMVRLAEFEGVLDGVLEVWAAVH